MKRYVLLESALAAAAELSAEIRALPGVEQVGVAGSTRRMREMVGDVDLVAASANPAATLEAFETLRKIRDPVRQTTNRSAGVWAYGVVVKLSTATPDRLGSILQRETGSIAHNRKLESLAKERGLDLDSLSAPTETEVYAALGLATPPPTLREDQGEIEAAASDSLPALVSIGDIRGEIHSHTRYSDGVSTVHDMALAAAELGYEYFAVTDHSLRPWMTSLSPKDLARQAEEVAEANRSLKGRITILHGVEANIDDHGNLDMPDELLIGLDVVVASIHGGPRDRASMTKRLMGAIAHPKVNLIGHPTSRFIERLPAAEFDYEAVFRAAAENMVAMEVNANPERLDLRDAHVIKALEQGCVLAINTDAHGKADFDRLPLGVATAQRGWATSDDVINTWPLDRLRRFLEKARGR